SIPGVPQQETVEAEALAQLLDRDLDGDTIDELKFEYAVNDIDRLLERLASDRRAQRLPTELLPRREGEVPPRGAFLIFDKALPTTGVDIAYEAVPAILATALVFGRETDRPARLEFTANRHDLPTAQALLTELAGDSLGAAGPEQIVGKLPASHVSLAWAWR